MFLNSMPPIRNEVLKICLDLKALPGRDRARITSKFDINQYLSPDYVTNNCEPICSLVVLIVLARKWKSLGIISCLKSFFYFKVTNPL